MVNWIWSFHAISVESSTPDFHCVVTSLKTISSTKLFSQQIMPNFTLTVYTYYVYLAQH